MSLFKELNRRNVFKVGIAYVVVAWLVLQVADVLFNNLQAPAWVFRVLLVFLVVGFPIAVLFAWAFELTPEGLRRESTADKEEALAGKPIVLATETPLSESQLSDSSGKSIAVLPFVNMSDDEGNEYFSDGVSEEILNLLSKTPQLRVAARTSSFAFKGKDSKISDIGDLLRVDHILEGSVRKAGKQVRITAQLVKVSDGYHLWSESYDHTLDNIFAIQDEIASSVAEQLRITLLGGQPSSAETDPEAFSLYLRARELFRQGSSQGWEQAEMLLKQSLDIAPDYAASWANLADVYIEQSHKALIPANEGYELAREAASKAITIDSCNADAHATLGDISATYDVELQPAAHHIGRALALQPTNSSILQKAADVAVALNRLNEAIRLLEYAVIQDPVNSLCHARLGVNYFFAGQFEKAIGSLGTSLQLSPKRIGANYYMGVAYLLKGDTKSAISFMELEAAIGSTWRFNGYALIYYTLGEDQKSIESLNKLIEHDAKGAAFNIAYICAFRGENDRAFEWLDKALEYKDPGLIEIGVHPLITRLQSDPRWQPFLKKVGRSPEQLAKIDFNVALPG